MCRKQESKSHQKCFAIYIANTLLKQAETPTQRKNTIF